MYVVSWTFPLTVLSRTLPPFKYSLFVITWQFCLQIFLCCRTVKEMKWMNTFLKSIVKVIHLLLSSVSHIHTQSPDEILMTFLCRESECTYYSVNVWPVPIYKTFRHFKLIQSSNTCLCSKAKVINLLLHSSNRIMHQKFETLSFAAIILYDK